MPSNSLHQADLKNLTYVLQTEAEGVSSLIDWLGDDVLAALDLMDQCQGRIIFSGMGKSGHVGHKISATLSSLGSPALFVHPGEASHGDLGMITKNDVVVLLSNSGETIELKDIINYCKRFSIPLIGIVRRKSSILVSAADVALILPEVPEACKVKAPTTSTTMMMALGDALSVALLERRGFNQDHYKTLHPGGKLGTAFLKVGDLMHSGDSIPTVRGDSLMSDVLIEITAKHFGSTAVVDDHNLLSGIITDGDLRRSMNHALLSQRADVVMSKNPITIDANALASHALAVMQKHAITCLFVLDNNHVIGILHIHDLLRAGV